MRTGAVACRRCCSVLQCVAVCCSVLQCAAVCCSVLRVCVLQCVAVCCSVLQCGAVCCSVLRCAAMCCSVLQCVAWLTEEEESRCYCLPALHRQRRALSSSAPTPQLLSHSVRKLIPGIWAFGSAQRRRFCRFSRDTTCIPGVHFFFLSLPNKQLGID